MLKATFCQTCCHWPNLCQL